MTEDDKLLAFFASHTKGVDFEEYQRYEGYNHDLTKQPVTEDGHTMYKDLILIADDLKHEDTYYPSPYSDHKSPSYWKVIPKYTQSALKMFYALDMLKKFKEMKNWLEEPEKESKVESD